MKVSRVLAAAAAAFCMLASAPPQALALPDLVPEIEDVAIITTDVDPGDFDEGCSGGVEDRRLVDFSLRTRNIGATDLFLGDPDCPNCTTNPGVVCGNPLFVCGTSHGHAHFESFARTELLDSGNVVVASGHKYGFCLLDLECANPQYSCSFQGISAGCSDIYSSGLPCQYVDITDATIPDGTYTLRVTIDPDNAIAESNEGNNVVTQQIVIGTTPPICPEYSSTDVPKAIIDNGTVDSTLSLPDLGSITSLRIRLSGEHTFVGDIDAHLISPASTDVSVMDQVCDSDNDFNLYLGDDAAGDIVCPPTDPSTLRDPTSPLAPFLGEEALGTWTLRINDVVATDDGTLEDWSLEVCTICGNGTVDPGEACDDGNVTNGDCCSADCLTVGGDGTPCTAENVCMVGATCSSGTCQGGDLIVCDPCLTCDPQDGCVVPTAIYPCQDPAPGKSVIVVHDGETPASDSVTWKWKSQTPVNLDEFGAPQISTELTFCVYDAGGLVLSTTAQTGTDCDSGACWDVKDTSATYTDPDGTLGGLTSIRIREGTRGKIVLKGAGDNLDVGQLFLSLPTTVRLKRNDGTPCWEAGFSDARINSGNLFKARSD